MCRCRAILVPTAVCLLVAAGACNDDPAAGEGRDDTSTATDTEMAVGDVGSETSEAGGRDTATMREAGGDPAPDTGGAPDTSESGDTGKTGDTSESSDIADPSSPETVTVVPEDTLDWTVDEGVVYGQGLADDRGANAGEGEPMDLKGDLYLPQGIEGPRPALLIVHGGGFTFGSRSMGALVDYAEYFAARGWVVFSISYRLAGDDGTVPEAWTEAMQEYFTLPGEAAIGKSIYPATRDAKAAVRFLQANAAEYDISPDHIATSGGSAGAHISVGLGATDPEDFRDEISVERDPTLETTHLDESGEVQAVLDFWGAPDAVIGAKMAFGGPSRWDANDAPVLIVHGTLDPIVPIAEGKEIRDAYKESGAPYKYAPLRGRGHSAWTARYDGKNLRELGHAFLLKHMDVEMGSP